MPPILSARDPRFWEAQKTLHAHSSSPRILVLGGTGEARLLAEHLAQNRYEVIYARAGCVVPRLLPKGVAIRTGGFGGAKGLASYLRQQAISALIDATHPFAERMRRHALFAGARACIPMFRLARRKWARHKQDVWHEFPTPEDLAKAFPRAAQTARSQRCLLALGGRIFAGPHAECWKNLIETRAPVFRFLARGMTQKHDFNEKNINGDFSFLNLAPLNSIQGEIEFMRQWRIDGLIARNSGGEGARHKILAARRLLLPVWMLDMPPESADAFYDIETLCAQLDAHCSVR